MNASLRNKFASRSFRRSVLLGLFGGFAILMGVTSTYAISSTNLGTTNIKLASETFTADADVTVAAFGFGTGNDDTAVGTTQGTATEVESGGAGKMANPFLTKDNFTYAVLVQEAAITSFQTGEVYKIEIYGDDGTTNTLLGTVFCKQDSVDDGVIEGCQATVDQGSATDSKDGFSVIVTQVAP